MHSPGFVASTPTKINLFTMVDSQQQVFLEILALGEALRVDAHREQQVGQCPGLDPVFRCSGPKPEGFACGIFGGNGFAQLEVG